MEECLATATLLPHQGTPGAGYSQGAAQVLRHYTLVLLRSYPPEGEPGKERGQQLCHARSCAAGPGHAAHSASAASAPQIRLPWTEDEGRRVAGMHWNLGPVWGYLFQVRRDLWAPTSDKAGHLPKEVDELMTLVCKWSTEGLDTDKVSGGSVTP